MTRPSAKMWALWALGGVLVAAALACNAAGLRSDEGTQATVAAVYATITAQAMTASPDDPDAIATATVEPGSEDDEEGGLTPAAPNARPGNGQALSVPRCTGSITIDGLLGDATSTTSVTLADNTFGRGQWTGVGDLSGEAQLCWTDTALYVAVDVTDDVRVQTQEGSTMWRGDEVELFLDGDLRGDFYSNIPSSDDVQLGLSPGNFENLSPSAVQYRPDVRSADVTIAAQRTDSGYTLEAAVPWSLLRVQPAAGQVYGVCLALSDNDQVGQASQDSMVSHCPNLITNDPTTWSTIELLGG